MVNFANKLVTIVNKKLEIGVAMNAIAHMSIGIGSIIGPTKLQLDTYLDSEASEYPYISAMPFIILRAKSNEIKKTYITTKEMGLVHNVFLNTMTGGTYIEQLAKTKSSKQEDLIFYGITLYGEWNQISELTRKFSLWQ